MEGSALMNEPPFDVAAVHRHFAAACFNQAWRLIEKPDRTPDEDESMLLSSAASLWHWTERPDCTPANKSIGFWQLSRISAILGRADEARRYGRLALQNAGDDPFLAGCAHEALARAELAADNRAQAERHIAEARQRAERVADKQDRDLLEADLRTLA
jgi:hypothetical protein